MQVSLGAKKCSTDSLKTPWKFGCADGETCADQLEVSKKSVFASHSMDRLLFFYTWRRSAGVCVEQSFSPSFYNLSAEGTCLHSLLLCARKPTGSHSSWSHNQTCNTNIACRGFPRNLHFNILSVKTFRSKNRTRSKNPRQSTCVDFRETLGKIYLYLTYYLSF